MSWRVVLITSQSKLSYRNGHLIIRKEETTMIHLSEIHTIIIEDTMASITAYLISELLKHKIKLIFCDEKRNPQGELIPYHGSHNSSKRIHQQILWDKTYQSYVWTCIIQRKISNQIDHLKKRELKGWDKLCCYLNDLQIGDPTNREGHAAKVYFNSLFGKGFKRESDDDINAGLNYGYSVLLSCFNKEIHIHGYLTQLGMKHKNEFNPFNLTSDIMEPFRVFVDEIVYEKQDEKFNKAYKIDLINLLNKKLLIDGKEQYLTNAVGIYVKSIFRAMDMQDISKISFFDYV